MTEYFAMVFTSTAILVMFFVGFYFGRYTMRVEMNTDEKGQTE